MQPERTALLERLQGHLSLESGLALRRAVALAEKRGVALYLVGGAVRDLLLGAPQVDVDVVVEGDAIALATALDGKLRARVVCHPRFGTAVVRGAGYRLDLARARTERYKAPGALPSVRPARLDDDLARRDFTINAMALRLTGPNAGELVDLHGGVADLTRRRVRVLHDASFQDDATRTLRALRYAGRLQFSLEAKTKRLLERDLAYLDTITGARLRCEFERIAGEERVWEIMRLAGRLGVLPRVQPLLSLGEAELGAVKGLPSLATSHRDAALFCLLLARAPERGAEEVITRLALTGRQAAAVRGFLALRGREPRLAVGTLRPSEAVDALEGTPLPAIGAFTLSFRHSLAADRARRYLDEWRFVRPRLDGRELEALGVPHGPEVGAAVASLRAARLDGRTSSREDEEALVRALLATGRQLAEARHG